jgi:NADPH:quinone reductase-like Zn-dependent oxidoreductase
MTLPNSQLQYQLVKQTQGFSLQLREGAPIRPPNPDEVVVRVRATSLNRRDIMIQRGFYPVGPRDTLVPLSDGAGEIVAAGSKVSRVKVGDRVAAIFFQSWLEGRPRADTGASALGGSVDGMLAEYVTLSEQGVTPLPASLSFEEGATLPCAAVTAWNGLFARGGLRAGDHVLLQGTGGVSIFGLQFAAAAGAVPFITSSSDSKLDRARQMGARAGINYRNTPEWAAEVVKASGGLGVHHVLEVGGSGTLKQSIAALAPGGHIAIIGGLSGFGGDITTLALIGRSASVSGIFVGSRSMFEEMNAFITRHGIRPVIDRVFDFKDADDAYAYMDTGSHFGKIVIRH